MKRTYFFLILILGLQLFLKLPFLTEPATQNETAYARTAQRLSRGEVLYKDVAEVQPPGVLFTFKFLGREPLAIRFVTALYGLLTTIALFFLGRKLFDDQAALWATLLFAVFSDGVFVRGAQAYPETFMALPLILAFNFFLGGRFLLAGLLSGLAFMFKQTAALNALALAWFALEPTWHTKKVKLSLPYWHFLLGFAIVPLSLLLYFFHKGATQEFIQVNFFYSAGMLRPSLLMFFKSVPLWLLAGLGAYYLIRLGSSWRLLVWSGFSLLAVLLAGFATGHYSLQLVPALCLLAAVPLNNWCCWAVTANKIGR